MDMSRGRNPSAALPPLTATATPVDLSGRLRRRWRRKRKSGTTFQVVTICIYFIILPTSTCRHSCVTPIHPPTHLVPCSSGSEPVSLRNAGTFHWRRRRRRRSAATRKVKNFRLTSRRALSAAVVAVRRRSRCCRCVVTASLAGFRHFPVWRTPLTVTAIPVSTTALYYTLVPALHIFVVILVSPQKRISAAIATGSWGDVTLIPLLVIRLTNVQRIR